jgi:hypothetical protein
VAHVAAHGIALDLPTGFEGRVYRRQPTDGSIARPVTQAASFSIPPATGDFGTGAVEQMSPSDVFLTLVELGPDSAGEALYRYQGMPRAVPPSQFDPRRMKRPLPGQGGGQWFFTETGRPFTLYVVLGSFANRTRLVPIVNRLLRGVTVDPLPRAAARSTAAGPPPT